MKPYPTTLGLGILLAAGCTHTPNLSATGSEQKITTTSAEQPRPYRGVQVTVSGEIVSKCKIDFDNVDQAPKFAFDRSALLPQDQSVLEQVAACLTTGPLKGDGLKLIGRADPRGEIEYNFVLGEHRAASVESYLSDHGVDKAKMTETSRGKLDATGADEVGWARDRRVDIDLK